eukprot:c45676_g1_i1.p1 GENE.c45676_g1_i1~~c45676_g1_i1.p1  ORF type:complete len:563 (+),score=123.15 c45676_g1_i1:36-1691(+)
MRDSKEMRSSVLRSLPLDDEQPRIIRRSPFFRSRWILAGLVLLVVFIVLLAVLVPTRRSRHSSTKKEQPRNLIFMIGDGFGPAQLALARAYQRQMSNDMSVSLPQDGFLVGSSRTQSSNSFITDSAAGATAFSCAAKTKNQRVSVGNDDAPCANLFEAATAEGFRVGIVSTSRVTHATPGSFSSHAVHRDNENHISQQQIERYSEVTGRPLDVILGGGMQHFLPESNTGSCRHDEKDLLAAARAKGYTLVENAPQLQSANKLPLLGLFASGHMSWEIDRASEQPSLTEMTRKALELLETATKKTDKGFALLVEGSRIDMACHMNDAATALHEILEFQNAWKLVQEFAERRGDTLVVATADHETGGLALGYQWTDKYPEYKYDLKPLSLIKNSTDELTFAVTELLLANNTDDLRDVVLMKWMGFSYDQAQLVASELHTKFQSIKADHPAVQPSDRPEELRSILVTTVNKACGIGFTTHGHTGVDVGVYAYGPGSTEFAGAHENSEIGEMLEDALELDISKLSDKVRGESVRNDDPVYSCPGDGFWDKKKHNY